MRALDVTREEAIDVIEYDKQVDASRDSDLGLEFDLSKEQEKTAKKMRGIGTRKTTAAAVKIDPIRSALISAIAIFLASYDGATDIDVVNANREILFKLNGEYHGVVLSRKTKMNK